ncbi:ubiquitin-like domain-containing protein [Alteribacillus sp. JSM 102045]|uniref:ubiquitin-like domain-containing protein n=1 Tax=Alteribacillus sp. JSM 102045 TaxID=1562101 RepID=UPI0035C176C1
MSSKMKSFFPKVSMGKRLALVFSAIFIMVAFAVYQTTKATVTIMTDDREDITVTTHAETVGQLLKEQELSISEEDEVSPSLHEPITGNMTVEWMKAAKISVSKDGEDQDVWTTADTIEEIIDEQNITLNKHDYLNKDLDTSVEEGMQVTYESAFPVTLKYDGEKEEVMTTSTTVADLLKDAGIETDKDDRIEPGKDKNITGKTDIEIVRVEKVTDVVEEEVDYATVTRRDDSLPNGEEEVVENGKKGVIEKHYEVVLEDGEEVSRELIEEELVEESKDKVVAVGARTETAAASRGGSSQTASERTISMQATAYTANCSGCSGVTATGVDLNSSPNKKVVAVDPSVIPLGSRVYVKGYGEAVAADTGGAIKGNKIDLHVPSKAEARRFGVQTLEVTVLD